MKRLLKWIVMMIAKIHDYISAMNDGGSFFLNDKQLHFVILGLVGLVGFLIIYPIFKWIVKKGGTMFIAWFYVFTCMIVLTFAIEIGQGITGTGVMEMDDVVAGMTGFISLFCVYLIIYGIVKMIQRFIEDRKTV